jgi:cytochrome P450
VAAVSKRPIPFFVEQAKLHGDVVGVRFPLVLSHLISHPDGVRHVLQEHPQNYSKGFDYEILKTVLGDGLLTSEGAFWKRQRRLAQPAFHRQRIQGFVEKMTARSTALADAWSRGSERRDVHADLMALTLTIVGDALFGAELSQDTALVGESLDRILHLFTTRGRSLWALLPLWLPTPAHLDFRRNRAKLDALVYRLIAARRASGYQGRTDLLSMLMAAQDDEAEAGAAESERSMTDQQLRDESMTMLLAGHETTANLLTWTFLALEQNPAVAGAVREEIDSVLRGAPPTLADLPKLTLVDRVLKESLRLYPPAWAMSRMALVDDEILGFRIPKGSHLVLPQYIVHRREDFWPEPARFDPERFTEAAEKQRPRYAYFPFGGGPRQCIGNLFAARWRSTSPIRRSPKARSRSGQRTGCSPAWEPAPERTRPSDLHDRSLGLGRRGPGAALPSHTSR